MLPQEAGAFGNQIQKEPHKTCLKLKKYIYIFTESICSACIPIQMVDYLKDKVLVNHTLKTSPFQENNQSYFKINI